MNIKKILTALVLSIVLLVLFLLGTDPNNLAIGFIMIPVVGVLIVSSLICLIVFRTFEAFDGNERKQSAVAVLFGSIPALTLVFQSTGGLVPGDYIVLALITVIGYLYVSRY